MSKRESVCVCVCVRESVCVCVCECVRVCEGERERERERERIDCLRRVWKCLGLGSACVCVFFEGRGGDIHDECCCGISGIVVNSSDGETKLWRREVQWRHVSTVPHTNEFAVSSIHEE